MMKKKKEKKKKRQQQQKAPLLPQKRQEPCGDSPNFHGSVPSW
jgi:hypothetical protein